MNGAFLSYIERSEMKAKHIHLIDQTIDQVQEQTIVFIDKDLFNLIQGC